MSSAERAERIEELFEQAARRPAEERAAYLEVACGDDDTLAREVLALLQAEQRAGDFLRHSALGRSIDDEPGAEASAETGGAEIADRQLGAYQLRNKIGEGGTGTVYLATRADDQFRKRVAIKLVPLAMASAEHFRRFRTERHILASLDHASIARLYDAGTSDEGLPYFVMEYIEGEPIDAYCDRHRLSVRERLELFREVCGAVHFAHQNLVVHRDLKPSNILVTAEGRAKLLDFGIAKLLNPELTDGSLQPTRTWHRVMTPAYASPEQIQGHVITTASDVYSLGVLLYRLLTGELPHRLSGKTPQEIERLVTTEVPERPSLVVSRGEQAKSMSNRAGDLPHQLAGDLDNIVLMALRQEPLRRYSSAEQLSEDIKRRLDGLPVIARQGTVAYRLGKMLRRNRIAVATGAVFLALVLGFLVVVTVQSASIARERDQARQSAERSEEVLAFMTQVFKEADPTQTQGQEVTLREALDRGSEKVSEQLSGQPSIQASLWSALGEIYFNLGAYERSKELLSSALETRKALLGPEDADVAENLSMLGSAHHKLGEFDAAEDLYRQALGISQRLLGDEDPQLLNQVNNLVAVLGDRGRFEEAVPLARQALDLTRRLPEGSGPAIMNALQNLAGLHFAQGDVGETATLLREALELQREELGAKHPDVAFAMSSLGVVLYRQGELEASREMHEGALAIQREVIGDEHPDTARSLHNLAMLRVAQGDPAAEESLREVLELRIRILGADHPDVGYTLRGLANLLLDQGAPEQAEPYFRRSLAIWRARLGTDHWQVASLEGLLGQCLTELGRYEEAESSLVASHGRLAEQLGSDDAQTLEAVERLTHLYESWGKADRAEHYRRLVPTASEPED